MMFESMLSTNVEIAPMHCCLGEPDCLVGIMLLFQRDWGTQHAGMAVVSVSVRDLKGYFSLNDFFAWAAFNGEIQRNNYYPLELRFFLNG